MNRLIISDASLLLKRQLNQYVSEAIEEKNEFNYLSFDFIENSLDEILDALETPTFFGDKKVVVCKNPYFINNAKVKLPFENDLEKLDKYLANSNPTSDLIIVCGKEYYNAKSKFISKCNELGIEVENLLFEKESEFNDYGLRLIRSSQIDIDDDAIDMLFKRCFPDVVRLEKEIAKLYLFGGYVDIEVIKTFVARPMEDDVFELSNAILAKKSHDIMRIYNDLKLTKTEPITLVALLANQFRLMLQVSILSKTMREKDIAEKLGVHPYRVTIAMQKVGMFGVETIKDNLVKLADLDRKIKNGEADRYIDFELFLATI